MTLQYEFSGIGEIDLPFEIETTNDLIAHDSDFQEALDKEIQNILNKYPTIKHLDWFNYSY